MTAANIYQDSLHYCKTAWQLVTHPFITIRALASTEPDRDDVFLYILNCVIQLIPNLLVILITLLTTNSLNMGGTGTSINVRTGLLHFLLLSNLLNPIIPILLCVSAFVIFIITLVSSSAFTASMLSGIIQGLSILAIAFFPISIWFSYLAIRFLKESSHLSYGRTILALALPTFILFLIAFGASHM